MAKAELLRVQDVRDAYRLIGDCRDLGSDPALWHRRMLEALCRLIGVPAAVGGEGRWIRPHRRPRGQLHARDGDRDVETALVAFTRLPRRSHRTVTSETPMIFAIARPAGTKEVAGTTLKNPASQPTGELTPFRSC